MTNFINTIYTPNGKLIDNFVTYEDIEDWFLESKLIDRKKRLLQSDTVKYFSEIIAFREIIRNSFMQYLDKKISLDELVNVTNNILLQNDVHPNIILNNNNYDLKFIPYNKQDCNVLLVEIAIQVVKLLTSTQFKYLKKCNNHKCSLIFLDTSKNHSRRWCSMEVCGNRSKVNKFTKRQKESIK